MYRNPFRYVVIVAIVLLVVVLMMFLRGSQAITAERYAEPDRLYGAVETNVRGQSEFEVIVDIDHSRLGSEAGSPMPPSHVLIWSDSELDAAIVSLNPVAAIDLPLRALAYEDPGTGRARLIFNSYEFIANRHSLPTNAALRSRYDAAIDKATDGLPKEAIARFPVDSMSDLGLVTLPSPFDFATTEERVLGAINSQSDTVNFGIVDFSERAKKHGITVRPLRLILFGGPAPGGKAMANAPTLGLDAFCQKLVIWEDADAKVHVTFNDLLALAERQGVPSGLALRVVNRRVKATFTKALETGD